MNRDKLIKNEQLIRDRNRHVGTTLKKYLSGEKGSLHVPIEFICECSDINCKETVRVSIAEYERLHKRNDRFLIVKGHKTPHIESTVDKKGELELVEKPDVAA